MKRRLTTTIYQTSNLASLMRSIYLAWIASFQKMFSF